MKFTKEDAYKELVGKMTAKGEKLNLSERSINEQLDALIPLIANEETEMSDFVDKVLPLVKTADNNVRNDVSVGINKYKEDNPPKQQAVNPTQEVKDEKTEVEKRIEALELELANTKRENLILDIRKNVISKLGDKGVKDKEWINSLLSEVNITEDFDVDTKVESFLNLYNKSQAHINPDVSPQGASSGKNDYVNNAIKQAAALAKAQSLVGKVE